MKIAELEIDDIVYIDGDIAKVVCCVHGNKYYAYCGGAKDDYLLRDNDLTQDQVDNAIVVNDGDDDKIPCCS